jgi:hypothetical protein
VFVVGQLQQAAADQGTVRQVEGRAGFLFGQLGQACCAGCFRHRTQIDVGQRESHGRPGDPLFGHAVDGDKAGAQVFVARHDPVERGAQGGPVEPALQAQRGRHVVGSAGGRIELSQEPQALLGE